MLREAWESEEEMRQSQRRKEAKGIASCVLETKEEENARETGFVEMPERAAGLQEKGAENSLKDSQLRCHYLPGHQKRQCLRRCC